MLISRAWEVDMYRYVWEEGVVCILLYYTFIVLYLDRSRLLLFDFQCLF